MPRGRPPVIENEIDSQLFQEKVDEMWDIGLKWTVIAQQLKVSDSFLLKWKHNNESTIGHH
jgi:hypothetical protein